MKKLLILAILFAAIVIATLARAGSVSDLTADTDPQSDDLVMTVDVSDTTMSSSGTNKKVAIGDLLAASAASGLSGATVVGTLMVIPEVGGATVFQANESGVSPVYILDASGSSGVSDMFLVRGADGLLWTQDVDNMPNQGLNIGDSPTLSNANITGNLSVYTDSGTSKTVNSTPSGNSNYIVGSDGENWVGINPGSFPESVSLEIGTDTQAYNAD